MVRKKKIGKFSEDCLEQIQPVQDTSLSKKVLEEDISNNIIEEIHCPLDGCQFICIDKKKLTSHLTTCRQLDHQEYRQHIKELKEKYKDSLDYQTIGCGKSRCHQCNRCNLQTLDNVCLRKEFDIFVKVYKRYITYTKQYQKKQIQEQTQVLYDWFYNHTNTISPNSQYELHKLSTFLKNGIDFKLMVDTLELLVEQGQTDLRYLSKYTIESANKYNQYKKQINIQNTIPYFVNQYYQSFCKHISSYLFGKDVERLFAAKNSFKLANEQINKVITYMIQHNIDSFNYIDRIILKVLLLDKLQSRQITRDEDYMQSVINELLTTRTTLQEVENTYDSNFTNNVIKKVKQLLFSESFNQKLLAIEWLFIIKFPLDKESYEFAKNNALKHQRKANFEGRQLDEYKQWLQEQFTLFERKC